MALCLLTAIICNSCDILKSGLEVTITSPTNDATFEEFATITFAGSATDEEDGPLSEGALVWDSSVDGRLGTGPSISVDNLSAGRHTITLTATDSDNNTGSDNINITVSLKTGLIQRGGDYMGKDFHYSELFWASVTMRDAEGNNIIGLELDDFTLTEALVNADGVPVSELRGVDIQAQIDDSLQEGWFWERSVGSDKLDVVFMVESRGTLDDDISNIRSEVHAFVERLNESGIDFRVAGVAFDVVPEFWYFDFYGPGELDRLSEGIDSIFRTAGIWWSPTSSYDALLWTPWLGFRDDAHKMCVIIADIIPQTVYGTYWYPGGCTSATLSAVNLFLQNHPDMSLYYCLNPGEDVDIQSYVDSTINPMAGNSLDAEGLGSGFAALEALGLAKGLRSGEGNDPWPFDQSLLPLIPSPVLDSRYYFVWETSLQWDDVPDSKDHPENYRVQASLDVTFPDSGNNLSTDFIYPLTKQETDLSFNLLDEVGTPLYDWAWAFIDYAVGNRMFSYSSQLYNREGAVNIKIPVGTYHMTVLDGGSELFDYQSLRKIDRSWITVPPEGLTMDVYVDTAEKEMELTKARGLLYDLDKNWRQPADPFREFVADAEEWLDEIESDGIDWIDMVRLKRFCVALSGYANMVEYGQQEIKKSVENVQDIIDGIAAIVDKILDIQETTDFEWAEALGILLEGAYDVVTKGEFTVKKEVIIAALEELLVYAGEELINDMKEEIYSQFPPAKNYTQLLIALFDTIINMRNDGAETDWTKVLEALEKCAISTALEVTRDQIAGNFAEAVTDGLELNDPLQNDLKSFVKDVLEAVTTDEGFAAFDKTIEKFATDVVQHLGEQYYTENHREVIEAVNGIFDSMQDEVDELMAGLAGAGFVRDFLVGMARDLALVALPKVADSGSISYSVDTDDIITILIRHTLYHVLLKDYFVDEVNAGLSAILQEAQSFTPPEEHYYDWEASMFRDFSDYRKAVSDLQDTAWGALISQEAIDNWANSLEGLVAILDPLSAALEFIAALYPPLQDTADAVDGFIAVLDGFQVISYSIEFGLRVDSLDTFGNHAMPLFLEAFGRDEDY